MGTSQTEGPKIMVLAKVDAPITDGMAAITRAPTPPVMYIEVTVGTLSRRTPITIDDMALGAVYLSVTTFEGIPSLRGMIEFC